MPVRNLVTLFLAALLSLMCHVKADRNRYATTVSEAMDLITFNYLEDVGYRDLYENAMRGMAEGTTFEERFFGFYYPMTGACDEARSYDSAMTARTPSR